ncbi:MAG: sulfotransferase [Terriglobales bacterium]
MNARSSAQSRSTAPVFVVGSARSGTTLFYDMLLSSGGFAVYLAESNVFNMLGPHFGNLRTRADREKMLRVWMASKLFRATGLEKSDIESKILESCHDAGDFLRTVMEAMVRRQSMRRWAENSVEGHIPTIKKHIPDALFIHMIRDGRDVATSLHNSRYVRTLPWRSQISLPGGGVYWEWVVERTSKAGRQLGNDYLEVHFEDLIGNTQQTLTTVGNFLDHELDYDRIRHVGYGSISKPNTLFSSELKGTFSPIGRWKKKFSAPELRRFEAMIGPTLLKHGYALGSKDPQPAMNLEMRATRRFYRILFESKWRVKRLPVVRWLRPLTPQFLDANTQAEDHPPEVRTPIVQSSSGSAQ